MYLVSMLIIAFLYRLHMLNEIESGAQALFDFPSVNKGLSQAHLESASVDDLRQHWDNRLNFTQVRRCANSFLFGSLPTCTRIPWSFLSL